MAGDPVLRPDGFPQPRSHPTRGISAADVDAVLVGQAVVAYAATANILAVCVVEGVRGSRSIGKLDRKALRTRLRVTAMPAKSRRRPVTSDADAHLSNVVGMVALDVVTRIAAAVTEATGLSMVQATALSALANYAGGGSIDALRRSVDLSHSATVRLVDRLGEAGYVVRKGAEDGRVSSIHLTGRGRSVAEKIRATRRDVLDDCVSRLSRAERTALAPIVDVMAARDLPHTAQGGERSRYVCRLCDWAACGHPTGCPVTDAMVDSTD